MLEARPPTVGDRFDIIRGAVDARLHPQVRSAGREPLAPIPEDDAPTGDDIRRALGHLAFNQRAALVMRELEGRSYAEIAEILDVSTSAVETLIFRARRALRGRARSSA